MFDKAKMLVKNSLLLLIAAFSLGFGSADARIAGSRGGGGFNSSAHISGSEHGWGGNGGHWGDHGGNWSGYSGDWHHDGYHDNYHGGYYGGYYGPNWYGTGAGFAAGAAVGAAVGSAASNGSIYYTYPQDTTYYYDSNTYPYTYDSYSGYSY